jgi:hypothetical protein
MLQFDLDKEKAVGMYFRMVTVTKNAILKDVYLMDEIAKQVGHSYNVILTMMFTALHIMPMVNAMKGATMKHVDGMV